MNQQANPQMTQANTSDTTLQKIRKLLALADGNKNENEREVAMQFAMDLLAKHNLTISQVQEAEFDQQTGEYQADIRLDKWSRDVVSAACTLYYTTYYIHTHYNCYGTRRSNPVFIGTEANVAVTIEVATWLLNSIRLESNSLFSDPYDRRSFRLGAAYRVLERARAMIAEEKRQGQSTGTSLMVVRNSLESANRKHLDRLNLRKIRSRATYIDEEAYAQGEDFGDRVGLARQAKAQIGMR